MNFKLTLALVAVLGLGCAEVVITTKAPDKPPVTVSAHLGGRGGISAVADPVTGKVNVTLCQAGESNWMIGRLFAVFGNLAAKVMAPIPILGEAVKMQGPSDASGCDGMLAAVPKPDAASGAGVVLDKP